MHPTTVVDKRPAFAVGDMVEYIRNKDGVVVRGTIMRVHIKAEAHTRTDIGRFMNPQLLGEDFAYDLGNSRTLAESRLRRVPQYLQHVAHRLNNGRYLLVRPGEDPQTYYSPKYPGICGPDASLGEEHGTLTYLLGRESVRTFADIPSAYASLQPQL